MPDRFRIAITCIASIEVLVVLMSAIGIAFGGLGALFFAYTSFVELRMDHVLYAAGCVLACMIGKKAGSYLTRHENAFGRAKDSLRETRHRLRVAAEVAAQQRMARRHP